MTGRVASPAAAVGRLFIVDDDAGVRTLVIAMLGPAGYEIIAVENADAMLHLIEPGAPSFVAAVVDYSMPRISGVELVRAMREVGLNAPIVLISEYGYDRVREGIAGLDEVTFLPKPFSGPELCAAVEAAVAASGRRQA